MSEYRIESELQELRDKLKVAEVTLKATAEERDKLLGLLARERIKLKAAQEVLAALAVGLPNDKWAQQQIAAMQAAVLGSSPIELKKK
jgi:hypothetical protein